MKMFDSFTILCLAFWCVVFFFLIGPLLVWHTGEEDKGTPQTSPQHRLPNTSLTQESTGNKLMQCDTGTDKHRTQKYETTIKV